MSLKEKINIHQKLLWLLTAGITETIGEKPVNRLHMQSEDSDIFFQEDNSIQQETAPSSRPNRPRTSPRFATQAPSKSAMPAQSDNASDILTNKALTLAQSANSLDLLYAHRASFDECPLKKTAAHTINGRGCLTPKVLCLIDTPDRSDDKTGILFSEETGQLLERMLAAIDLDFNTNTYVSSLIPWRPPGNRTPTDVEKALCKPFWEKEISLLKPRFILALGGNTAGELIGIHSLSKARSAIHDYAGIPVCTTISPAVLIRMPAQRRQTWEDLKKFKSLIDSVQSSSSP